MAHLLIFFKVRRVFIFLFWPGFDLILTPVLVSFSLCTVALKRMKQKCIFASSYKCTDKYDGSKLASGCLQYLQHITFYPKASVWIQINFSPNKSFTIEKKIYTSNILRRNLSVSNDRKSNKYSLCTDGSTINIGDKWSCRISGNFQVLWNR